MIRVLAFLASLTAQEEGPKRLRYHEPPARTHEMMREQHRFELRSPLTKDTGRVESRKEWYGSSRPELIRQWTRILGKLGPDEGDRKWFGDISKATVVSTREEEGYTRIHLRLPMEKDFLQDHLLLLPKGQGKGPFPAVIAWTSTTPDFQKPEEWWGAWLARRGYVVLTGWSFIRNYRESRTYRDKVNEAVYERFGRWLPLGKMVHDVQREVEYLRTRVEVDSSRIGFIGFSLSAKTALYVAAFAPEVTAVVSVDPHMALHGDTNYGAPWYLDWTRKFEDIETPGYPDEKLRGTVWSLLDADPTRPGFERNHHELLSLCAPRAFLLIGCSMNKERAVHSDDLQSWGYFNRAKEVYTFLGIPERLSFATSTAGHRAVSPDTDPAWKAFFERWLKKEPIRVEEYSRRKESPLSPEEAVKTFALPEGFRIELAAAEPETRDPVAMAFDRKGRMLVVEMADYPVGPPSGRVRILVDRNGDGRFETSTLFANRVPFPTGVVAWGKGLLVCSAPDILYLEDTDGDGKADVRKPMLTGFGTGENPQSFVNNPKFGMDGWIYLGNGGLGGTIADPARPGKKPVPLGRSDLRWRPDTGAIELLSGRSQYAMSLDDWDRRFINSNSDHIRHPVLPLRYLARNPHLRVTGVEENISDHGTAARVFQISRGGERYNDPGHAGHFTAACSVTVYRGDTFPGPYRGNAFVCEPVHNLVHRDVISERGASLTARRAREGVEFLASTDEWFRPVNLCTGPDGSLYVVDFYRAVVDHPKFIPLAVQKRIRLLAGNDRGRIWRIVGPQPKARPKIDLEAESTAELVDRLSDGNAWWRLMAQQVLMERKDRDTAAEIHRLLKTEVPPATWGHALWTLQTLGDLDSGWIDKAMGHPTPAVREQGVRLAEGRPVLWPVMVNLDDEPSPRVRFQIALSLGGVEHPQVIDALSKIAVQDAADEWTRQAVLASMRDRAPNLLAALRAESESFLSRPDAGALDLVRGMAGVVGARRNKGEARTWVAAVLEGDTRTPAAWQFAAIAAVRGLVGREVFAERADEWREAAMRTSHDAKRAVSERIDAIHFLTVVSEASDAVSIRKFLATDQPQEIQVEAIRALVSWPGVDPERDLLPGWSSYTVRVRRELLGGLFRKGAEPVLRALEKEILRPVEIGLQQREVLLKHRNAEVRERAKKLLATEGNEDREELVEELTPKILALKGDRLRGEKVFKSNCASCHRFYGQGHRVGPNLASVSAREKEKLLSDILNPNGAMDPRFQVYVVTTKAGDLVTGLVAAETPGSITLLRAMGEQKTVLRGDIKELKAWPASLMPDGVENNVSDQGFADLLEYLKAGMR